MHCIYLSIAIVHVRMYICICMCILNPGCFSLPCRLRLNWKGEEHSSPTQFPDGDPLGGRVKVVWCRHAPTSTTRPGKKVIISVVNEFSSLNLSQGISDNYMYRSMYPIRFHILLDVQCHVIFMYSGTPLKQTPLGPMILSAVYT